MGQRHIAQREAMQDFGQRCFHRQRLRLQQLQGTLVLQRATLLPSTAAARLLMLVSAPSDAPRLAQL